MNLGSGDHESTENWAIVCLIVFIIVFSAVFEACNHAILSWLKRQELSSLLPMLNAVFKELTILGFISLLLFTSVRTGAAQALNDRIFGQSETEKVAIAEAIKKDEKPTPPTQLQELFEEIHILIFVIMVMYILEAAFLLIVGRTAIRGFERLDRLSVLEDFEADYPVESPRERLSNQALAFYGLKYRFLEPRILAFPVPEDAEFQFSKYLSANYTDLLVELIELPVIALMVIFMTVLALRPLMGLPGIVFLISLVVVSGLLCAATVASMFLVHRVYRKLIPNLPLVTNYIETRGRGPPSPAQTDVFKAPIDDSPVYKMTFLGPRNRIAREFPFSSIETFRTVLQLLLFFNAAFAAIVIRGATSIAHHQNALWWEHRFWFYPLTLGIVLANLGLWTRLIREFNYVTCLDCQANVKMIEEVDEEAKNEQLQRHAHLLRFLFHKADHAAHRAKTVDQRKADLERASLEFHRLPKHYRDLLTLIFTTVSRYHDRLGEPEVKGVVTKSDLRRALRLVGWGDDHTSNYILAAWFDERAETVEGFLTFTEFVEVIMLSTALGEVLKDPVATYEQKKQRLGELFDQLDENKDNKISVAEFKQVLQGLSPPPSTKEIQKLVWHISRGGTDVTYAQLAEFVERVMEHTKPGQSGHPEGH